MNIAAETRRAILDTFRDRIALAEVSDTAPLEIIVLGDTVAVPARRLASYTAGVSDIVLVVNVGRTVLDYIILGEVL
ncbi:MAG: hypothetical protein ACSLE9_07955 [Burkholderiaceae bacterium]